MSKRFRYWIEILFWLLLFTSLILSSLWAFVLVGRGQEIDIIFSIIILASFTTMMWRIGRAQSLNYENLRSSLRSDLKDGLELFKSDTTKLLDSKVDVKPNKDLLIEAIGDLYNNAAMRTTEGKAAADISHGRELIIMFGASDVQPKSSSTDERSDDGSETPFDKYTKGRNAAEAADVIFHRYVRLFDDKNFRGRSFEIRRAYLVWLKEQISTIERYKSYVLMNARRAPRWKAIRSNIIAYDTYIDILGDGEAGFVIKGRAFAQAQIRNSNNYIRKASGSNDPILNTYDYTSVGKLKIHLEEMTILQNEIENEHEGDI